MEASRTPRYRRAVDLPPELRCLNTLNAYETGAARVRLACELSDPHHEVAQLAILSLEMDSLAVTIEQVYDQSFIAFHSHGGTRDLLVETGSIVRSRTASGWHAVVLEAGLLLDAFSLGGELDFVCGDGGQIFRCDGPSAWTREPVDGSDRLFAMHGTSPDRLYAVGRNGTVLKRTGGAWQRIGVAVETDLRCVLVDRDRVLVAGDCGIAGAIVDGRWVAFETGIESDVLAIGSFGGITYFGDSDFGVHRLVAGAFEPVANLGYVYRVNGGERWLTAVAGEYIFQFDGTTWRGVELSYRDGYRADAFDMAFLQ